MDTLVHPGDVAKTGNAGTLSIARSNPLQWNRHRCDEGSAFDSIEWHPKRGIMTLIGSEGFATGEMSQTKKRDLQRAVTAVILAYNEASANEGDAVPQLTLHENHLVGDGKVHEDRKIPRQSSERDYDYYHTLGVVFADNGKMLPHYHLEFNRPLDRNCVGAILQSLAGSDVGPDAPLLSAADVERILRALPPGYPAAALSPMPLPPALPNPADRARRRDELEGAFIALSSANTEGAAIENMHMNSFRPAEPLMECFPDGHTAVMTDLQVMEAQAAATSSGQFSVTELLAIERGLRQSAAAVSSFDGGTEEERHALSTRLTAGANQAKLLLELQLPRPPK
jgi:hypothetical protein